MSITPEQLAELENKLKLRDTFAEMVLAGDRRRKITTESTTSQQILVMHLLRNAPALIAAARELEGLKIALPLVAKDRDQWKARAEECENLLRHTLPILRKDFPETTRQITAIQIEDCLMKTAIQREGQPPPGCDFPDLTEYKIMTRNPKDSPSID